MSGTLLMFIPTDTLPPETHRRLITFNLPFTPIGQRDYVALLPSFLRSLIMTFKYGEQIWKPLSHKSLP